MEITRILCVLSLMATREVSRSQSQVPNVYAFTWGRPGKTVKARETTHKRQLACSTLRHGFPPKHKPPTITNHLVHNRYASDHKYASTAQSYTSIGTQTHINTPRNSCSHTVKCSQNTLAHMLSQKHASGNA